jgi:two-component system sensor histidine kinase AlgZ
VEEEIEFVRAYLTLEQERWGTRLRVEWDVDDAAHACPLPPLVLDPTPLS